MYCVYVCDCNGIKTKKRVSLQMRRTLRRLYYSLQMKIIYEGMILKLKNERIIITFGPSTLLPSYIYIYYTHK